MSNLLNNAGFKNGLVSLSSPAAGKYKFQEKLLRPTKFKIISYKNDYG